MRTPSTGAMWRVGMAVAIVLLAAEPAPAFYWSLRAAPSIITPTDMPGNPPNPGADPLPIPPDPPGPPGGGEPGTVPEPATAAAGLLGLGLLGMRRLWNLKKT